MRSIRTLTGTLFATAALLPAGSTSVAHAELPDGIGVVGDSGSDEYQFSEGDGDFVRTSARCWVELLAVYRALDFGSFSTINRGEPRRRGYEYNWARAGDTATGTRSNRDLHTQLPGVVNQVASGDVDLVYVGLGTNDFGFVSNIGRYRAIHDGTLTGDALTDFIESVTGGLRTAVDEIQSTGRVDVVMGTIIDNGVWPIVESTPVGRARVTEAVIRANAQIKDFGDARHFPIVDIFGITNLTLEPSLVVGGVSIDPRGSSNDAGNDPRSFFVDGVHTGTIIQGLIANAFIMAANMAYGVGIDPMSAQEILLAAEIASGVDLDYPPGPTYFDVSGFVHFTPPDCNGNGVPDGDDITAGTSADANGNDRPDECEPGILFVDATATAGRNVGTSWADAFTDLQDALFVAKTSVGFVQEIWVAAGTYRPSLRTDPSDPRSATFQLAEGLALYGGFAGTETARDQRNPYAHVTILSGDLADDDQNGGGNGENCYHVVTASGTSATAVLDGFSVTAGNANIFSGDYSAGGGMISTTGSPTVRNCIFRMNAARFGAGLANIAGSTMILNCLFAGNQQASTGLGGASTGGGGVYNTDGGTPSVINTTFAGNTAQWKGGGIYNLDGNPCIVNAILWNNTDSGGSHESAQLHNAPGAGTPFVAHSCIEGLGALAGNGNVGDDPQFVDADGADGIAGTLDDDLRLLDTSPCIDAGDSAAVPGNVATDLAGNPRIMIGAVDMGAYEAFPPPVPSLSNSALALCALLVAAIGAACIRRNQSHAC